jgi:transcriptional regulator with XRE-family HTH domain
MMGVARKPTSPEGERMYELRTQADVSQSQLGQRTGVHFTAWSKFESGGRQRPLPGHIELFVRALGLSDEIWDELLTLRRQPYGDHDKRPYRQVAELLYNYPNPRPNTPDSDPKPSTPPTKNLAE